MKSVLAMTVFPKDQGHVFFLQMSLGPATTNEFQSFLLREHRGSRRPASNAEKTKESLPEARNRDESFPATVNLIALSCYCHVVQLRRYVGAKSESMNCLVVVVFVILVFDSF
jgi:hypothetical protein